MTVTTIGGQSPTGTYSYGQPYTICDRAIIVPAGSEIRQMGANFPAAAAIALKLVRIIALGTVGAAASSAETVYTFDVNHAGGGSQIWDLPTPVSFPFDVVAGVYSVPGPHNVIVNGSGLWLPGNSSGQQSTWTQEPVNIPPLIVVADIPGTAPPPPPPTGELKPVPVFAVIRKTATQAWHVVDYEEHKPLRVASVSVDANGYLLVFFDKTYPVVGAVRISPDETYVGRVHGGGSLNRDRAIFRLRDGNGNNINPETLTDAGGNFFVEGWMWDN